MVRMAMTEESMKDAADRAHGGDRIILCRDGVPFCAVVPVEDAEWADRIEEEADLKAAEAALREPGVISWIEAKRGLGLS